MNAPVIDEIGRIRDALACIPADLQRDEWARIGAALKHEMGDAGFDLFDEWSKRADSYDAAAARGTWRSLSADAGIKIGTLFHVAREHGFDLKSNKAAPVDPAELERRRVEREKRAEQEAREREMKTISAAGIADAVKRATTFVSATHPYLERKGVKATATLREIEASRLKALIGYTPSSDGKPLQGRILIAPVYINGKLSTVEMIDENGLKSALAGGVKAGGYWATGPIASDATLIYVCEGVATGLSVHECTGAVAVAALTCGNLRKVAEALKAAYPGARIVVCGDLGNGSEKAREAAQAIGGALAFPDFGADRPDGASDFNDMHLLSGVDAVRACIEAAVVPSDAPSADAPSTTSSNVSDDLTFPTMDERPCWRVYDAWGKVDGNKVKPGVYWHGVKIPKGDAPPELIDKWICSPLWVRAVTRSREDGDYGRLLEFLSTAGKKPKKWSMPMAMLAGDGNEVLAVLLSEGVIIDLRNRNGVTDYIIGQHPKLTMRAASVTGWHDDAFVLPDVVIGADDVWFQASARTAPYGVAGTFEGWRDMAALARGNPLLMLAICASLAGPLLGALNVDGGGLHFVGDSSTGKTTALLAGISAWGGPAFKRTWRATANGLEGAGSLHSDTLLALDEIGEIEPKSLYESSYALFNGTGKTRANRDGKARQAARWRVFLLSTGEVTVAARMSAGGIEAKAGQEIRILDIPIAGAFGLFDDLHGRASGGVLSDEVRNLATKHYGHAGPLFVEALVRDMRDGLNLAEMLQPLLDRFQAPEGQERRAARTFALCALAGELSVHWSVTPWEKGEPTASAMRAFKLWRDRRGTNGRSSEHVAILRAVSDFIDRHGDARFSNIAGSADLIRDRAGYWKDDGDRRLFLFTSGGLRDATKGYDLTRVTAALDKAGALESESGRHTKSTRTPDGRKPKLYHVDAEKLTEGE
ncbi:putative DNA primase/helicase [Burkholderia multivorans]